jgi:hypothetical protein
VILVLLYNSFLKRLLYRRTIFCYFVIFTDNSSVVGVLYAVSGVCKIKSAFYGSTAMCR